jgi:hypothetical protein
MEGWRVGGGEVRGLSWGGRKRWVEGEIIYGWSRVI